MGKKPAVKAKAKAQPKTEAELKAEAEAAEEEKRKLEARRLWQQRKDAGKWAQKQIEVLAEQREAAVAKGSTWLEEPHKWHELQLKQVMQRLELKLMDGVPDELKASVESYASQCADGAEDKQAAFKDDREMYAGLPHLEDDGPYVRAAQSPEAVKIAEELAAWTDTSAVGVSRFVALMREHRASAAVQEAGVTRIGFLVAEAPEGAPCEGFTAEGLMPAVEPAMREWIRDPEVQRRGCAALRSLAKTKGQISPMIDAGAAPLLFNCVKEHFKIPDVVLAGTAACWEMSQAAGKFSPEVAAMRHAGLIEIFQKVMTHHAWDQTLVGRVRVVLPFLKEE